MDLVILHYHLNRGGVTRVIENHLRALAQQPSEQHPRRAFVVYGGRAADWDASIEQQLPFPLQRIAIPELDYDELHGKDKLALLHAMRQTLSSLDCETTSTVLHIHNHSLGKNAGLPYVIATLANGGWRFLLQVHDFAEDLRPQNYRHMIEADGGPASLHAKLYPQAPQIHYATLNQRDHTLLQDAGLSNVRLHRLPNPVVGHAKASVSPSGDLETRNAARAKLQAMHGIDPNSRYVLYPVRGIRRKNLGELLLWASLYEGTIFATTLPPINLRELHCYAFWKQLAAELQLPVLFEAGEHLSLAENYAASDAIVTTSVAEGFGLAFLEASLMRRPLIGRDLPGITADFRTADMQFPGLASSFRIPADWIDLDSARQTMYACVCQLRNDYGLTPPDEDRLAASIAQLFSGEHIDFGRLSSSQQATVIRELHCQPDRKSELKACNPMTQWLVPTTGMNNSTSDLQQPTELEASIEQNIRVIEQHYALQPIGARLSHIYSQLVQSPSDTVRSQPGVAEAMQLAFLEPHQIHPVRLET